MKKTIYFILVIFICLAVSNAKEIVEKTIAVVNGEHIMFSEFDKIANETIEQYKKFAKDEAPAAEKTKGLKKNVLDQMIDERLILQKAKSQKIKVSKRELENNVKKVRDNFKSEAEFNSALKKENLTLAQFENRIKDQTMQIKLIDLEVREKVPQPDEKETRELYEKIKAVIDGKELTTGTTEETKNIKDIAEYVKKNFSELVRARHILIRISKEDSMVEQLEAKKKLEDIKKKLYAGEDFGELAKKYSEDTGSAEQGGDLDYLPKEDFTKLFGVNVYNLPLGGASDIVKTEFGYHLVKMEAKSAAKTITYEKLSKDLSNILYKDKAEKKYSEWLVKLRSEATIKRNPIE